MIERIESFDDPRIRVYRNLRDAELAAREGLFIGEGEQVVRTLLLASRFRTRSLLLSETRLGTMRDAVERVSGSVPVYVAAQGVMDAVVGFHIHRGALAAGERGEGMTAEAVVEGALRSGGVRGARVVVMETIANHDNVGGVLRNAAALGVGGALLDARSCDPLYRKAIRVSMGGALRVPFAHGGDAPGHIALLRERGFTVCALTPAPGADDVFAFAASQRGRARPIAVVLGAEGPGLRDVSMDACDVRLRIDMEPDVDSLNVATASGVALAALRG